MADLTKTVEIIFGAVDHTGNTLSGIAKNVEAGVDAMSGVTEPLAALADKALKAEAAVLAVGAALLTVAVNEASQFGEKIEEIGSLTNNTAADNDQLAAAIQNFAETSVSNFEQIGQAVYVATSNLGDTSKALDVLGVAEQGAIVGATNLETTASLLTRTMNAYGLVTGDSAKNTENAERVMAAMFTTVQAGDTNMQLLADNLGKVASTASAANVPIETVGAAIAALTGAGIGTDQAMTLLNALLKELLNPSEDLAAALGGLSVTADGLPKVLSALQDATGGSAEKVYALFSSTEAAKGALVLANDNAGKFDGTLKAMTSSVAAFNANYATMAGGVEDSTQQLANNTKILLQKVGAPLQDDWAGVLDGLKDITQGLSLSVDRGAFEPVFAAFDDFGGDLKQTLTEIGQNLPAALQQVDFAEFIDALGDAGIELSQLFGDVDLSTPEGLAKAIQFVVDSFESLTRVVAGVIAAWGPVVQGLLSGVDAFNDLDDGAKKSAGQLLGVSQVFESLKGILLGSVGALDSIGDGLKAIAGVDAAKAVAPLLTGLSAPALAAGAAAVAAVGFAVKENAGAWQDYSDRQKIVAESTENLTANQAKIKDRLAEISDATGMTIDNMDELNKAVDDGRLVFNDATGAYEAAGAGVKNYDAEVQDAADKGWSFADAVNNIGKALGATGDAADDAAGTFASLQDAEAALLGQLDEGKQAWITYADGVYTLHAAQQQAAQSSTDLAGAAELTGKAALQGSAEWKRVQEVLLETQKQTDDFKLKLGELANARYAIDVKANVDLKVAQIEADTQRISAAFQAATDVIGTLTQGTTDLWTEFGKHAGFTSGDALQDAAQRMEARLDQELELKRSLTEAVVAQAQATAQRLNSGEALISIDAGELAPELELIFDKILKYTQTKATQQGLSLLLGLNV